MAGTRRPLRLRGHHAGCLLLEWATKKGDHPTLPPAARSLEADPERLVELCIGPDDVCEPCPHWTGGSCDRGFEELNRRKDAAFLEVMRLRDGEAVKARELVARLHARADRVFYRRVCAECSPDACAEAVSEVARLLL